MIKRLLKKALRCCVALYLVLIALLYFAQERLIYPGATFPPTEDLSQPELQAFLSANKVEVWKNASGGYQGFKKINPEARSNWIYFYGNGDHAMRASAWFQTLENAYPGRRWNGYVMEYPGYGLRPGRPDQSSIQEATRQALASLENPDLPLLIAGQSLGSAVAVQAALDGEKQPEVLLLITPFTTMTDAGYVYLKKLMGPLANLIPLPLLLKDKWDSLRGLGSFSGKVAIAAAEDDTTTPLWMAREINNQLAHPKFLITQKATNHWIDWDNLEDGQKLWDFVWPGPEMPSEP